MTREQFIDKIESLASESYYDRAQFTIDFFDGLAKFEREDYVCNEEEDLGALEYDCDNILVIMRKDLADYDIISKLKHYIKKRLKTIRDEK